jgi:pimeloyl-ACP methyl ester carboxylesterase
MLDEAALIARVESANTDELGEILRTPTREQEKTLRAYFGEERYQRLHAKALRSSARRSVAGPVGNVVVLHGILGSELSSFARSGTGQQIWARVAQIIGGGLGQLRLGDDGRSGLDPKVDVRPSGIMKRHYGELLLSLSERWRVRAFWYDWRKDLGLAAAELEAQIGSWFEEDERIHLVAHSMGGLVARTFVKNYPKRWAAMWDREGEGRRGGRLVMLGTPNHGSFAIPQIITGADGLVQKLALLDVTHNVKGLIEIFNSFPGLYQMLPSPLVDPEHGVLYESKTYGELSISQRLLDAAAEHHGALADVVDPNRMFYVAGANRPTFSGLTNAAKQDFSKLASVDGYELTMKGDGRVSHVLGLLATEDAEPVPAYYVDESHGNLSANERVLSALDDLLESGATNTLPSTARAVRQPLALARSGNGVPGRAPSARQLRDEAKGEDEKLLESFAMRFRARAADARAQNTRSTVYLSSQERAIEEIVTRDFLSFHDEAAGPQATVPPFPPPTIEVALVAGEIQELEKLDLGELPCDAVAVGHYIGVRPQAAERALDLAISEALPGQGEDEDGLLSQFAERGIIQGSRGQIFYLPDPRTEDAPDDRTIAVVGMGYPGRFGVPELTLVARELSWSLGRMGKKHLATVLIGAGNGNIPPREAVDAWIRGVKHALTGTAEADTRRIRRITFVEEDPRKLHEIDEAIWDIKMRLEKPERLHIDYRRLDRTTENWKRLRASARRRARDEADLTLEGGGDRGERQPTRVTLALDGATYRFGAITEDAALPERAISLDPKLVNEANDELAAEWRPQLQQERGRLMERLLVPEDLRPHLASDAPLVLVVDTTTARIHWEMVAQSSMTGDWPEASSTNEDLARSFLGTSRGFTRQLLTSFAPAPQPPPPSRRQLRVLVVADPAEDARLPGAEEEGVEVADLFESFNELWEGQSESRVEVVRLLGPSEATRTHVLRHLMLRSYDVLHFCGHCVYDEDDPSRQGWVFTGGDLLSPNELNRIDRIPKFVFSNACESGITPDRSEERSAALAPGFAESFFQRGVANFVCTAWPVDDAAARQFARTLYSCLLGLPREAEGAVGNAETAPLFEQMHVAMREARLAIFDTPGGTRTWGAYQHYGNPYFQFFDPRTMKQDRARSARRARTRAERALSQTGSRG